MLRQNEKGRQERNNMIELKASGKWTKKPTNERIFGNFIDSGDLERNDSEPFLQTQERI